tara:strand:- start:29 stop:2164 length:2136 start_codon:yes stop_codon:yes gene_type:complete
MTSHGDAVAKMSAFASRADSFVNAALDQLDDAVEQAFVGESSDEVAKIQAAAMTPAQSALLRTTAQFWSTLALDAKREDWRDAATVVASAQASVDDSKRTLAEAAREAQSKKTPEAKDALVRALTKELSAVTKRADFAETAFMSMLNDIDEAPDPATPLAMAQNATEVVVAAARSRAELEQLRKTNTVAAEAAAELERLKASLATEVEEAASLRARDAEGRAAAAEVKADANLKAREAAEQTVSDLAKARDAAESRAFELETAMNERLVLTETPDDHDTEHQKLAEEIRRLRRELDTRSTRSNGDSDEGKYAYEDDKNAKNVASLREKLAVRDTVVEQLKVSLEELESVNEREREGYAARERDLISECEDKCKLVAQEAQHAATSSLQNTQATIAALENKCAVLRALVDAEDGEAADELTEGSGEGSGLDDSSSSSAPLAAARARNRRLAADASEAKREAMEAKAKAEDLEKRLQMAETNAASCDVAVAELEKHLVATTTSTADIDTTTTLTNCSLLPMITAQRDRHKKRAGELEANVLELENKLETEKQNSEKSKRDAVFLYDKVRHVQDFYTANDGQGNGNGPVGGTRIVRVDESGVAVDREDGPLAALAARRQKLLRYGCFPGAAGGGATASDSNSLETLPGGDPGGVLARYALTKNNSAGAGLFGGVTLGGKTRAAKITRLFFVVYLIAIHAILVRVVVFTKNTVSP